MLLLSEISWNLEVVSDIASCISVLLAIAMACVTTYFQAKSSKDTRLSNSANMVVSLAKEYNSTEMRKRRQHFAKQLLSEHRKQIDLGLDIPVLEFFEDLGHLTKIGVLDRRMVWNCFFWSIQRYYLAITQNVDLLTNAREKHKQSTLYRELEWLYDELSKVDNQENSRPKNKNITSELVANFLKDESNLIPTEGVL